MSNRYTMQSEHKLNHSHGCPTLRADVSPHIAIESSNSHAKQTITAQSTQVPIKLRGMLKPFIVTYLWVWVAVQ